jgi:hypothetical protein
VRFGDAKITPIRTGDSKCDSPATPSPTPFDSDGTSLGRDVTAFLSSGRVLRDEAAHLIRWVSQNRGKEWWGESQEA